MWISNQYSMVESVGETFSSRNCDWWVAPDPLVAQKRCSFEGPINGPGCSGALGSVSNWQPNHLPL